jgi:citrate synthase
MADEWMTTAQAAKRLGVKPETLYAYVSRGLLASRPTGQGRRASLYNRAEVERLAGRARRGGRAGALEVLVDSGLTLLDPDGHLFYRGWDATEAAGVASYERVAEWLWTGFDREEPPGWHCASPALEAARACTDDLADSIGPVDRMRVACPAVATTDPFRNDRRPDAVAGVGRSLVAALVESLPSQGEVDRRAPTNLLLPGGSTRKDSIAARLWPKLTTRRATSAEVGVLNSALVLLADHELAASTLAARIAASTWADPYLVVQAGLAVVGGPLHGASSEATRVLFAQIGDGMPAPEAIGSLLRTGSAVPGLGHAVYRSADPRAVALLAALSEARPPAKAWSAVTQVLEVTAQRGLAFPNVDLALGAVCYCLNMSPGAGEAIFALARIAGWLAHAIEEYPHRLRFRPRAVYTGPDPNRRA